MYCIFLLSLHMSNRLTPLSSACSSSNTKAQKLRYTNNGCSAATSGTSSHIAEIEVLNKNEIASTQGTSSISQLIPSSTKSVLNTCTSNMNDLNVNISANLPTSSNHNNLAVIVFVFFFSFNGILSSVSVDVYHHCFNQLM